MTDARLPFDKPFPWIMAHRGDMVNAPENTLTSFRLAIEGKTDLLETDLRFTADGHLVCHHDATALRMTGDRRAISEMTLGEVRALTVKDGAGRYRDERIPTLDELLAITPPDVILALELKDPAFANPVRCQEVADRIAERLLNQTVIAVSFHLDRLRAMKQVAPTIPTGHISSTQPWPEPSTELVGPYSPLLILNPFYVRMAHRRGQYVCVLDNRLPQRLDRFLAFGVDAVLSDEPARTYGMLAERGLR